MVPIVDIESINFEVEHRKLRFLSKIRKNSETGCWIWTAGRRKNDWGDTYGQFYWGKINGVETQFAAHRAAWEILCGPIPEGKMILHKCNTMLCCNPAHLAVGDHEENMKDRDAAGRTSKGEHRYNYKRRNPLLDEMKQAFRAGLTVKEACERLGVGWQTIYRARDQDSELRQVMAETKFNRYSKAAHFRMSRGRGGACQ